MPRKWKIKKIKLNKTKRHLKILRLCNEIGTPKKTPDHKEFYKKSKWRDLRLRVFMEYGRRCLCCGSADNLHVDHIIPRSVNKSLEYDFNNLQVLCERCNTKKGINIADYRRKNETQIHHKSKNHTELRTGTSTIQDRQEIPTTNL